jgi:hypothetical protein
MLSEGWVDEIERLQQQQYPGIPLLIQDHTNFWHSKGLNISVMPRPDFSLTVLSCEIYRAIPLFNKLLKRKKLFDDFT